ncbi:MAG TPA: hypothetical protein VM347_20850 [Nonomuraea sp.]|nr:hypothetical protein [Nonomuraea sp.]
MIVELEPIGTLIHQASGPLASECQGPFNTSIRLLRTMIRELAQWMMDAEVAQICGALRAVVVVV